MASPPRRAGRAAAGGPGRFNTAAVVFGAAAAAALAPLAAEIRIARPARPLTGRWQRLAVEPAGDALLGVSFRPLQAQALGLDPEPTLAELLDHPFRVIRLAAYWDRMEPGPGRFDPAWLDWQVEAAERAGKQIIICLGPVKAFGYPEFFVPAHRLPAPLPERRLVTAADRQPLLDAGTEFIARVVGRYAACRAVIAWQVEHEAVDPLGVEHSWRLAAGFVRREVAAVRAADPSRPVLLNGFLPTSTLVAATQWWRTRDQGDSLAVAEQLADIVGVDYYPRHALAALGGRTVYLDGGARWWGQRRRRQLQHRAAGSGTRLMFAEIQAEPWEPVTTPPSPSGRAAYSCPPEHVIANYNRCARWARETTSSGAWAHLFWGAEYWILRGHQGDPSYLQAFARVLHEA